MIPWNYALPNTVTQKISHRQSQKKKKTDNRVHLKKDSDFGQTFFVLNYIIILYIRPFNRLFEQTIVEHRVVFHFLLLYMCGLGALVCFYLFSSFKALS